MFDLIGDIHGHADELERLLVQLGYQPNGTAYAHPTGRKVIFLGDYIDRGPQIRRVLQIVRGMVDAGTAHALIGNHEFNAIAYHTEYPPGSVRYLRAHDGDKNDRQHAQTLRQFGYETDAGRIELLEWVEWMRTLQPWLDLPGLRAIHACWDQDNIAVIRQHFTGSFIEQFMVEAMRDHSPLYEAVEVALKGPELKLPDGHSFADKDGTVRREIRTRWFTPSLGKTYRDYGFPENPDHPPVPVTLNASGYPVDAPPVFFGHYWLQGEHPVLMAPNVACLDWSVAKGGMLVAYRWDGEQVLSEQKLIRVPCATSQPDSWPYGSLHTQESNNRCK